MIQEDLERKLINNKPELNSINILKDSMFVEKRYISTNGNYDKVIEWQKRNKKTYMKRYDLNNDEVIYNINLIRDYKLTLEAQQSNPTVQNDIICQKKYKG